MTFNFVYILALLGTAAFAVSGALAASRKNMDIFGFCFLALMPAVGGGTIRDIVIGNTPVFWISDSRYVAVAIVAALVVYFTSYKPGSRRRILIWMDAMGLALFAAIGTQVSLAHDTGALVAVMLGVTTAVTGGMIRDIICNEIPLVLSHEIYATAAFVSGITYVVADNFIDSTSVPLSIAVVAGFAVRALAIVYDWTLPKFGGR